MPEDASHKLDGLDLLAHPKLRKHMPAHMARDCCIYWPKAKTQAQAKTQSATPAPALALAPASSSKDAQILKGAHIPVKAP